MVRGSFKILEAVIVAIGISAGLITNIFCPVKDTDTLWQLIFGCMIFAALAFFVRPIWLLVNWWHMCGKEYSAMVTDIYLERYGRAGNYKFTKLTYGEKKNRKDITVANVMFFSPMLGETYKLVFSSRKPEEFLILSAARMNAVVFALLGITAEIALILIMLNLKG